ncbi:copper-containing nitrite reductase [Aureibaculum luteum]|uniref:copper-containing nitrite reductase n=1 Tax=Aureibaculum luteum TaxID=1548456 RepID=UPI000E51B44D|nr:copper-containing nitrite reductase [Aureibaculum luteum]
MSNFLKLVLLIISFFFINCKNGKSEKENFAQNNTRDIVISGTMDAELTSPPFVPAPVGNRTAKKLIVNLEIIEKEGVLSSGVSYMYWTFGGTVPGSFIRARIGDEIHFTLSNHPDNKLPHNIDLHAVNGPGGGAESSFVAPGYEKLFSFKALNPGLFVYHCATAPVGMHIANGMYGLILIEPEGGLPKVDKEYYIMQGEFYTPGEIGDRGLQPFDMKRAIKEDPNYVVFNGSTDALLGDKAITAKSGETVRLFVGNGGPNLTSSFHVIGEIFDNVNIEGGSTMNHNVQTTSIPSGGAAIVEFKVDVPGNLVIVDHAIFRAFNKGALGILKVGGEEDKRIYSGVRQEGIYHPEGGTIQEIPISKSEIIETVVKKTLAEKIEHGKIIYNSTCLACHQGEGQGIKGVFPPLAKSDYLNANVSRAIDIVLHGKSGEIKVNGEKYNNIMPKQTLTDNEVMDVLNYVYNSWGNNKTEITSEMVAKVKASM